MRKTLGHKGFRVIEGPGKAVKEMALTKTACLECEGYGWQHTKRPQWGIHGASYETCTGCDGTRRINAPYIHAIVSFVRVNEAPWPTEESYALAW